MKIRKVALIVFYDKERRVLVQDRRGISRAGEEWGWFGGAIEQGETPEQAIRREVKEELSYGLKELSYLTHYRYAIGDLGVDAEVFVAPMPKMSELKQAEGRAMHLLEIRELKKLKMAHPNDLKPLDALKKWFEEYGK